MQDGGAKGLFRGNLANVLKVAPESGIKFFTHPHSFLSLSSLFYYLILFFDGRRRYEAIKDALSLGGTREIGSSDRFMAGAAAGVAAHVSTFPLEGIALYCFVSLSYPLSPNHSLFVLPHYLSYNLFSNQNSYRRRSCWYLQWNN